MKQLALIIAAALALAGCGGGGNAAEPPRPTAVSALAAFDTGEWLGDFALPDATEYWTAAEARNGNTFPIKAKATQEGVLVLRLKPGGQHQVLESGALVDVTPSEFMARLEKTAASLLAEGAMASSAALVVLPHIDTPWPLFVRLCRDCARLKVANLWLATRDTRDGACRLLPLKVDVERGAGAWLGKSPELPEESARLQWLRGKPVMRFADNKSLAAAPEAWGKQFSNAAASLKPRPRRLQVQLTRENTLRDLQTVLHELSPAAFAQVEPFWPMLDGSNLLEIPEYWKAAPTNEVEITDASPDSLLELRLQGSGYAVLDGATWASADLAGLRSRLQELAARTTKPGELASDAHVVCYAQPEATWLSLIELCRACVSLRIARLALATADREGGERLLALHVDISQADSPWYAVSPDELATLAGLYWTGDKPTFVFADGNEVQPKTAKGWGRDLRESVAFKTPRPRRLQVDLPLKATLRTFETVLREAGPSAFSAIEPFWPVLIPRDPDAPVRQSRNMAVYPDEWKLAERIQAPTMSEYWRAAEQSDALPGAAVAVDGRPTVVACVDQDNQWTSRTDSDAEWQTHDGAAGIGARLLQLIGPGGDPAGVQLILAMDRRAHWAGLCALLDIARQAGVERMLVIVQDQLGPTLRLFELATGASQESVARVKFTREGIVEDGKYTGVLYIGKNEYKADGPRFLSTLSRHVVDGKVTAESLSVQLPADEPAETFFRVLNALARLNMRQIRVVP